MSKNPFDSHILHFYKTFAQSSYLISFGNELKPKFSLEFKTESELLICENWLELSKLSDGNSVQWLNNRRENRKTLV